VLRQISSVKDISQNVSIEIDYQLKRLNKLEFSVSYPYLFDIFDDLLKGNLSDNTITEILKIRNLSRVNEEMGVSGRGVDGVW
jgi:hypothetical protein